MQYASSTSAIEPLSSSVVEQPTASSTIVQSVYTSPIASQAPQALSTYMPTPDSTSSDIPAVTTPASSTPAEIPVSSTATTSSHSESNWWVPTEIMTQSTTATATGTSIATATLPQAIAAATEIATPDGYTLITIGFKEALNYNFVVNNPVSSAQIFAFLPEILNNPFNNQFGNISITELVPLHSNSMNYLATVAKAYFPTSDIDELSRMISNNSSPFYSLNEGAAKYLAYLVDPSIPLTGLLGRTISSGVSTSNSTSNSNNNAGSLDSNSYNYFRKSSNGSSSDSDQSTFSRAKIIGLVVGIVVGVCVSVAAMVILTRLYIIRRQKAQDVITFPDDSSMSDSNSDKGSFSNEKFQLNDAASISPSMRINNWMNESHYDDTAGPGIQMAQVGKRSVSMPKISRPIATQNSLGWNEI